MLYKVTLNYFGESLDFHTHADSLDHAKRNAITRLAKKIQTSRISVSSHVHEKDRITIQEISEV